MLSRLALMPALALIACGGKPAPAPVAVAAPAEPAAHADPWGGTGLTFDRATEAIDSERCAVDSLTFRACANAFRKALRAADPALELLPDTLSHDDVASFGAAAVATGAGHTTTVALRGQVAAWKALFAAGRAKTVDWSGLERWFRERFVTADTEARLTGAAMTGFLQTVKDPFYRVAPAAREETRRASTGTVTDGVAREYVGWGVVRGPTASVGYLNLPTFFSTAICEQTRKALATLAERGDVARLLIDLRQNRGGLVDQALCVAEQLLPAKTPLVVLRGADGSVTTRETTRPAAITWPLVVLVGPDTESAAELFAGALQRSGRGLVVGTRTYGKGTVQLPLDAGPGEAIVVYATAGEYQLPGDVSVQGVGVVPDVRGVDGQGAAASDGPGVVALYLDALRDADDREGQVSGAAPDPVVACARAALGDATGWTAVSAEGAQALARPVAFAAAVAGCL